MSSKEGLAHRGSNDSKKIIAHLKLSGLNYFHCKNQPCKVFMPHKTLSNVQQGFSGLLVLKPSAEQKRTSENFCRPKWITGAQKKFEAPRALWGSLKNSRTSLKIISGLKFFQCKNQPCEVFGDHKTSVQYRDLRVSLGLKASTEQK